MTCGFMEDSLRCESRSRRSERGAAARRRGPELRRPAGRPPSARPPPPSNTWSGRAHLPPLTWARRAGTCRAPDWLLKEEERGLPETYRSPPETTRDHRRPPERVRGFLPDRSEWERKKCRCA
ncbi:hypothetical protein EYF80_038567 [Liparis tanakae]|uniref:Uncharacterized protein n=1 Tax=Liparis tanakae TaxID=230148 RepID=A0A4Z2GCG0_9TELE|nr:hypothetical protein EYF80_038567 [Liparis tanakae]